MLQSTQNLNQIYNTLSVTDSIQTEDLITNTFTATTFEATTIDTDTLNANNVNTNNATIDTLISGLQTATTINASGVITGATVNGTNMNASGVITGATVNATTITAGGVITGASVNGTTVNGATVVATTVDCTTCDSDTLSIKSAITTSNTIQPTISQLEYLVIVANAVSVPLTTNLSSLTTTVETNTTDISSFTDNLQSLATDVPGNTVAITSINEYQAMNIPKQFAIVDTSGNFNLDTLDLSLLSFNVTKVTGEVNSFIYLPLGCLR